MRPDASCAIIVGDWEMPSEESRLEPFFGEIGYILFRDWRGEPALNWSQRDMVQRLLSRIAGSKYNYVRARTCPIPRMVQEVLQDGDGAANP